MAALALELAILTAGRSGEVLNANWSEFDLGKKVWTIPAIRMKAGYEHRVPLSDRAVDLLKSLPKLDHNPHVFPGNQRGKPLSSMAMTMHLRRMGRDDITVHGFRSTFRDWASEQTSFPHETCEHALAHRISDKAEAAYRRGDQFEKRRKLMEAWAAFCEPKSGGNIIRLAKS
jgi:integrase